MRLPGSRTKLPKVVIDGEELDPSDAIEKALEGVDEAIENRRTAGRKLAKEIVRYRSSTPPPLSPDSGLVELGG